MKPALKKMLEAEIVEEKRRLSDRLAEITRAENILRSDNPLPVWNIYISSPWDGEQILSASYEDETLAHAIKRAATDFCRLNGRIIPGQPSNSKDFDSWKHWDVSGRFSISLCVGSFSMRLNPKSFQHHIKALRKDTDEDWYSTPEPKVAKIS